MKRKKLFVYAKANVMIGHKFSDDVAICKANNLEDAMNQFLKYYTIDTLKNNVYELYKFNSRKKDDDSVCILTDY